MNYSPGWPGHYGLLEMRRDSDRSIAGYRRRKIGEPDIDTAALAESLQTLLTVWHIMAGVSLVTAMLASQATV